MSFFIKTNHLVFFFDRTFQISILRQTKLFIMENKNEKGLFMVELGGKPKGRNIEQHDIFFGVGTSIDDPDMQKAIRKFWPDPEKLHIDGYVQIKQIGNYLVKIVEKQQNLPTNKLFFANLGGYQAGWQYEVHKRLLLVLEDIADVKFEAQQDRFFSDMDKIKGAMPHVDDKLQLGADVDDEFNVADHLGDYGIELVENIGAPDSFMNDWVITGYKMVQS